jgi:hypothetical protein
LKKITIGIVSVGLLIGSIYFVLRRYEWADFSTQNALSFEATVSRTYRNYGEKVVELSKKQEIPAEYVLAVIALECSGRKLVPHRFEPKVYDALKKLQKGELERYDNILPRHVKGLKNGQLKKLASSWGPMQLMGYKCFELRTTVNNITGKNALKYGVLWIRKNYGPQLKKGNFRDAFHIHNTGRKYPLLGPPRTYHRNYVPGGLKYAEAFKVLLGDGN